MGDEGLDTNVDRGPTGRDAVGHGPLDEMLLVMDLLVDVLLIMNLLVDVLLVMVV